MGARRLELGAWVGRCSAALHGCQQGRSAGATAIHNVLGTCGPGLLSDPRAWYEHRQACQLRPLATSLLLQVFETLSTADHHAIKAFRFDAMQQVARRV